MLNIGEWIRSEIRRRGLTEEECQIRSGMTQPNWSRLVNSPPQQPRKRTMEAVAHALDMPLTAVMAALSLESGAVSFAPAFPPQKFRAPFDTSR